MNETIATPYPECSNLRHEVPVSNNKIREINIQEVHRGYIVRVGCHTFAISTLGELLPLLNKYLSNPQDTENLWFEDKLFNL